MSALAIQPSFFKEILSLRDKDPKLVKLKEQARAKLPIGEPSLKERISDEAHNSRFSVHPGGNKMYQDLKHMFWWLLMKKDITEYVSRRLTCQKVKSEHKRSDGLIQTLEIPLW